ncbi:type II/IV secretion system protein [bacterium]|nr:type II/IV secretion system protein [bacterium]
MSIEKLHTIISSDIALKHRIIPLSLTDNLLQLGHNCDQIQPILNEVKFLTGLRVEAVEVTAGEFDDLFQEMYGEQPHLKSSNPVEHSELVLIEKNRSTQSDDGTSNPDEDSAIKHSVQKIISDAIRQCASDIHIESYEHRFRIRYRLDGVLFEVRTFPFERRTAFISCLKIMADLDIAEKRRPQDGRIRVQNGNKAIDIRVSTLPTDFGEKIVLRILDKNQVDLDLTKIGLSGTALSQYKQVVQKPYGMILVTGPTGSGKTTTLYATLNFLNTNQVNIITIEDPIEYNLSGINQSQVKKDIGYNFASALRAFLRQDPDIIMVGEIRDSETAEIAVRSALTGHLVLSTLHTNDAAGTLTRLIDMGQEPFLIASSVKMVVAQRLVRKICEHCKIVDDSMQSKEKIEFLNLSTQSGLSLSRGEGCDQCNQTGYSGRIGIFEIMIIDSILSDAILRNESAAALKTLAVEQGMKSLHDSAVDLLYRGRTTIDEVIRIIEV